MNHLKLCINASPRPNLHEHITCVIERQKEVHSPISKKLLDRLQINRTSIAHFDQ